MEDASSVDPVGHRVVLDNEYLRVVEVRVPEGTSLPMHSHPPRLIVAIGSYRLQATSTSGAESVVDRRPGEVAWTGREEHAAQVIIGPVHAIEVEVKSAAG